MTSVCATAPQTRHKNLAQQDSAAPNTIKKDVSLLRMKVAIVTMFSGLSSTYSLVNVVADQIQMLLQADIPVKVLVSETCPDSDRTGIFLDQRIEWVKVTNTLNGKNITWHDYSHVSGNVHETFFQEADVIAADFVRHLKDVDVCILHDILYQGWHLVHNIAIRTAQKQLPMSVSWPSPTLFPSIAPEKWSTPFPHDLPACPGPGLSTPPILAFPHWPDNTIFPRGNARSYTIHCRFSPP